MDNCNQNTSRHIAVVVTDVDDAGGQTEGGHHADSPLKHFIPGVCQVCYAQPESDEHLSYCSQCQLLPYCSTACQMIDWPAHRDLCQTNPVTDNGMNIFSAAKNQTSDDRTWLKYRLNLINKSSVSLNRELSAYEEEVLIFPHVCEVCHESNPKLLEDCVKCHSVAYCCQNHRNKDRDNHKKWCTSLQLATNCYIFQGKNKIPILDLPAEIDAEYCRLPDTFMEHLISNLKIPSHLIKKLNPNLIAPLSERLSYPLSLLYALERVGIGKEVKDISEVPCLVVHIVGAESTKELVAIIKWEYLLHRIPSLEKLNLVFVGPQLYSEQSSLYSCDDSGYTQCSDCQTSYRVITYEECQMHYHEYVQSQYYSKPDVIITFNQGFNSPLNDNRDTCIKSLRDLTCNGEVSLIFTTTTKLESLKNLEVLKSLGEIEVALEVTQNPYSAILPTGESLDNTNNDSLGAANNYISAITMKHEQKGNQKAVVRMNQYE